MKVIFIYILVLLMYGTNCISQSRIKTVDDNYVCFIINENDTNIIIQTFKKRKEILKKSIIIKREDLIVSLNSNKLTFTGNIQKLQDDEFEMITSDSVLVRIKINTIEDGQSEDAAVVQLLNELIDVYQTDSTPTINNNSKNFGKFGVTVGNPLFIMMNYGISNDDVSAGISLGNLGVQVNGGINIFSSGWYEMNLMLNLNLRMSPYNHGMSSKRYEFIFLAGPLIDIYVGGLHLQVGMGFGSSRDDSDNRFLQLGYAYRWRK